MPGRLSESAQAHRIGMWALIVLALIALGMAYAGLKGWVTSGAGRAALLSFFGLVLGALWVGRRGHRQALADRDRISSQAMVLAMAAALARG